MAKKGKAKISKVKRNNQTTNKMRKAGQLKLQRHKPRVQKQKEQARAVPEYSSESEASGEEWADMLDDEEQQYILSRIAKQPQLLSDVPEKDPTENKNKPRGTKRKKKERVPKSVSGGSDSGAETDSDSNSEMEEKYEKEIADRPAKKMRPLLPIKTKQGVVERAEQCEETESEGEESLQPQEDGDKPDKEESASESEADSGVGGTAEEGEVPGAGEVVTTVQLLAARRDRLAQDKQRIGALCCSLLECPEKKLKNLYPVLYLMEERLKDGSAGLVSVRKLAARSAAEVFRDILPDYCIRHQDYSNVKLKKDTLALYKYEKELLEFYKRYLQRLEKTFAILRTKKGDNRLADESSVGVALVSLECMCSVLAARPHFNYGANIARSLAPLLAAREPRARRTVARCFEQVFAADTRGDITLTIVRLINQLVRRKGERLPPSALECLLALRLQDVDLDQSAEIQHKKKQEEKHKKRIVNLSKKEKKRAKKLKEVERELLETEAQESAAARRRLLADAARALFHAYFTVIKRAPHSALLPAALQGLAKFTHVINLEYYSELVGILTQVMRDERSSSRTRLLCARTALALLAGAGDALALDPARAHAQLYRDCLAVHAGGTARDSELVVSGVCAVEARARRVAPAVLQAFGKRLCSLALQLPPHAALAALALLHRLAQHKPVAALLEAGRGGAEAGGAGRYEPLLPSPEHCGAAGAAPHELPALRRHHHPAVRAAAAALLNAAPWPTDLTKMSPMKILEEYDGSQMSFRPAVPPPRRARARPAPAQRWARPAFGARCRAIADSVPVELTEPIFR